MIASPEGAPHMTSTMADAQIYNFVMEDSGSSSPDENSQTNRTVMSTSRGGAETKKASSQLKQAAKGTPQNTEGNIVATTQAASAIKKKTAANKIDTEMIHSPLHKSSTKKKNDCQSPISTCTPTSSHSAYTPTGSEKSRTPTSSHSAYTPTGSEKSGNNSNSSWTCSKTLRGPPRNPSQQDILDDFTSKHAEILMLADSITDSRNHQLYRQSLGLLNNIETKWNSAQNSASEAKNGTTSTTSSRRPSNSTNKDLRHQQIEQINSSVQDHFSNSDQMIFSSFLAKKASITRKCLWQIQIGSKNSRGSGGVGSMLDKMSIADMTTARIIAHILCRLDTIKPTKDIWETIRKEEELLNIFQQAFDWKKYRQRLMKDDEDFVNRTKNNDDGNNGKRSYALGNHAYYAKMLRDEQEQRLREESCSFTNSAPVIFADDMEVDSLSSFSSSSLSSEAGRESTSSSKTTKSCRTRPGTQYVKSSKHRPGTKYHGSNKLVAPQNFDEEDLNEKDIGIASEASYDANKLYDSSYWNGRASSSKISMADYMQMEDAETKILVNSQGLGNSYGRDTTRDPRESRMSYTDNVIEYGNYGRSSYNTDSPSPMRLSTNVENNMNMRLSTDAETIMDNILRKNGARPSGIAAFPPSKPSLISPRVSSVSDSSGRLSAANSAANSPSRLSANYLGEPSSSSPRPSAAFSSSPPIATNITSKRRSTIAGSIANIGSIATPRRWNQSKTYRKVSVTENASSQVDGSGRVSSGRVSGGVAFSTPLPNTAAHVRMRQASITSVTSSLQGWRKRTMSKEYGRTEWKGFFMIPKM